MQNLRIQILISLFCVLIFVSCNNPTSPETRKSESQTNSAPIQQEISYSIVRIDRNDVIKSEIQVRISDKLTKAEIRSISEKVKEKINPESQNMWIFYFLPEMEIDNGAWARAQFTPELNIEIIGHTIEDDSRIKNYLNQNKEKFIGQWTDNFMAGDIIFRMRNTDGEIVLEAFSPSEGNVAVLKKLRKSLKGNRTIYIDIENTGDYFLLETDGNLSAYDNDGFVSTYVKIN